ncbi:MAG: phosphocholine cytidylyltransferase family protein [Gemmatimonadota bacterium]
MKALILAAGRGRRLWPQSADCPKCLLAVGSSTILEHQLGNLAAAGVRRAVVISGHGFDRLRQAVLLYAGPVCVDLLYNPFYGVADNLISLWSARSEMDGDYFLVNGDNVFHPAILVRLAAQPGDACVAVNRKRQFDEDDAKVQIAASRVRRIGKALPPRQTDAESIGIMRFSGAAVPALRRVLEEAAVDPDARRRLFLDGIQMLIDRGFPVHACDVGDLPWADVDTPEDLTQVRRCMDALLAEAASPSGGGAGGASR